MRRTASERSWSRNQTRANGPADPSYFIARGPSHIPNAARHRTSLTGNVEFVLNIIPTWVISVFAESQLPRVLFFAVQCGLAGRRVRRTPVVQGDACWTAVRASPAR